MRRYAALLLTVAALSFACAGDGPSHSDPAGPSATPSDGATTPTPTPSSTPSPDADHGFAVLGDWGSGSDQQQEVADRMCRWRQRHGFEHVLTVGDNIYPDGSAEHFEDYFFDVYACLLDDGVRWHSALGNHDIVVDNGSPELDEPAFGLKARNYVVRKKGIRFVIVDSNHLKMRFIRRQTRVEDGDRFTVVLMHHPVFSGGDSHGPTPGLAEKVGELFSRRGVDLVLSGHDHVYSVSRPVAGVRYVVTGGGGAALNGCRSSVAISGCQARYHFLYLSAGENKLTVEAVPRSGAPFHTFTVRG